VKNTLKRPRKDVPAQIKALKFIKKRDAQKGPKPK
jgi:hypothetical protein